MFRKATIAAAALIALAGVLTGCSASEGYTGTAIVKEHAQVGKHCYAQLETSDQKTGSYYMGRRETCYTMTNGTTVKMENGNYTK